MQLAGQTVPNPVFFQVDENYITRQSETIDGPVVRPLTRKPPVGDAYLRPRYTIRFTFEDLTASEKAQFDGIIDELARTYGICTMAGLGTVRYPPGGSPSGDSAYVTLAPHTQPRYDYSQGYRDGQGPILYKLDLVLLGFDILYLTES